MFKLIKKGRYYYITKEGNIITTPNSNQLFAKNKDQAISILKQLKQNGKDELSTLGLSLFACNLKKDERYLMENKILQQLDYDNILYRCNSTIPLNKFMDTNLNKLIFLFKKKFKLNLIFLDSILKKQTDIKKNEFKNYLRCLDIFYFSLFYKLSLLTKSAILTYLFIEKKISPKKLFKLSNLENIFQQKDWGVVEEQKIVDEEYNLILKKFSIFLKNIS